MHNIIGVYYVGTIILTYNNRYVVYYCINIIIFDGVVYQNQNTGIIESTTLIINLEFKSIHYINIITSIYVVYNIVRRDIILPYIYHVL